MESNESKLYAFDATEFEIVFNARPSADNPTWVSHKLRKPTLEELTEWEKSQAYETVEITKREDQILADDETANARLWEKLIISVKGYEFKDNSDSADWHSLTDEQKRLMRSGHKAAAVRGLYLSSCKIESNWNETISFSPDTWKIRQEIGSSDDPYVIIHTMREPTESERQKFRKASMTTSFLRAEKKAHVRIVTNLRAHCELYDSLIERVDGGLVGDQGWELDNPKAAFLKAIDPVFKRQVVQTLMTALEVQLQD